MNYRPFHKRFVLALSALTMSVTLAGLFIASTVYSQDATMSSSTASSTSAGGTLADLIKQKAQELQTIEDQKSAIQKNLDVVTQSKSSLSRDLNTIDASVQQVNLSIKENQIRIDQLGLEIQQSTDAIATLKTQIDDQRAGVLRLFVSLEERDHDTILTTLLRNEHLSDSVADIQATVTLSQTLVDNVKRLGDLENQLTSQISSAQSDRAARQVERVDLVNRQYIVQDQQVAKQQLLAQTNDQEQVYQSQLSALEQQQQAISDEIAGIESILRKNIDPNLLPLPRPGVLLWPVKDGRMTQGYGRTDFAIKNYHSQWHNGIDIDAVAVGTEVYAAEDGTVIDTGNQDQFCPRAAYGRFIEIKHNNGLTTLYGHLSRSIVTIGEKVKRGDVIGYLGKTGWATGPHTHFSVFASQTLTPARPGLPEGAEWTKSCGPMPVGGDLDPRQYLEVVQ